VLGRGGLERRKRWGKGRGGDWVGKWPVIHNLAFIHSTWWSKYKKTGGISLLNFYLPIFHPNEGNQQIGIYLQLHCSMAVLSLKPAIRPEDKFERLLMLNGAWSKHYPLKLKVEDT